MLLLQDGLGRVLLIQRPPVGLWGGLWGLPEIEPGEDPGQWCRDRLGLEVALAVPWRPLRHSFSHFHLDITPWPARVTGADRLMETSAGIWYKLDSLQTLGLAAPVGRLLERLRIRI